MNLKPLFYPKSVAIIGASHDKGSVGNDLVRNLTKQGFRGKVYAVNPKGGKLYGLKVKKSLSEIKGKVDLIVVAVPAKVVPGVLKEAAKKKVKAAVVISSGFNEVGNQALEEEITNICQQAKIALIGPNCLGIINPEIKLGAAFTPLMPKAGSIAFVSQSGALCSSVLDYANGMGIGFSKFVSIGNKNRKELLTIAALLHDIAKIDLLVINEDGTTSCPGHEAIGSSRVKLYAERFGLDQKDLKHAENLVLFHGFVGSVIGLVISSGNEKRYMKIFKEAVGDLTTELLLFFRSDVSGSDLKTSSPRDFKTFISTIENLLKISL